MSGQPVERQTCAIASAKPCNWMRWMRTNEPPSSRLTCRLRRGPGPHIPVDKDAPLAALEGIAAKYPVFKIAIDRCRSMPSVVSPCGRRQRRGAGKVWAEPGADL